MEERKRHEWLGYRFIADWARIYLGEVYFELLSGKEKPSLGVFARNFIFLVRTLSIAAQMAFDLLSQAWANEQIEKSIGQPLELASAWDLHANCKSALLKRECIWSTEDCSSTENHHVARKNRSCADGVVIGVVTLPVDLWGSPIANSSFGAC